ncbi:hypothetical protein PMZ80_006093 [Knufia obscura]|uniref:Uncharacterized protein n=2 Tax=Knufia TaxID=430999 RepID=A0AAN8F1L4_9EURO|nr:hypothetical protein PMZ80_006093 [Knufia obscura]KAK5954763.1 hypothetical protein OHC33_004488 [Knufia fluminis]
MPFISQQSLLATTFGTRNREPRQRNKGARGIHLPLRIETGHQGQERSTLASKSEIVQTDSVFRLRMLEPPSTASCTKLNLDDNSIPRLPPPASSRGHSRSRTSLDIPPLYSRSPSHSPTRSSTFLPFFSSSRSPSPRRAATPGDAAEFTIDEEAEEHTQRRQRPGKVERITSWFEGSSEPVNIGLITSPTKEQEESEVMETMFSGSREGSQEAVPTTNTATQRPVMQSANNSTSRFSFFRRPSVAPVRPHQDELESLSIRDTLFPDGHPDEFSPAAFKNLQQNAEGALKMFQQAYRESMLAMRRAVSEKNIQADELEASQTRNEHLKAQLLEIADRAADQEKLISSLQAENEQMKANEAALRSIRVITDHTSADRLESATGTQRQSRRNRSSDVSYTESIDSASTDLSTAASVFSHDGNNDNDLRSPGTSVGCPSPIVKHARVVTPHIHQHSQAEHLRSMTTNVMVAVPECQKCHGQRSDEAWEILGVMKAESAALKERVQVLEKANESAMDLLTWMPNDLSDVSSRCSAALSGRSSLAAMDAELMREDPSMKGCIV